MHPTICTTMIDVPLKYQCVVGITQLIAQFCPENHYDIYYEPHISHLGFQLGYNLQSFITDKRATCQTNTQIRMYFYTVEYKVY